MSWTKISIDEICIGVATPPPTSSWTRRWNLALLVSGSDQREGGTGGGSEETGCGTTTNSGYTGKGARGDVGSAWHGVQYYPCFQFD